MEKNEIVTLNIEDMSDEGLGIGRIQEENRRSKDKEGVLTGAKANAEGKSGMAVFVKDSVAGDRIAARIVKMKKTYAFGRVEKILAPSPDRVEPVCPAARSCGGCQIQEMSYPAQLRLKEKKVRNNLQRIGGIVCADMKADAAFYPILGMSDPYFYRNKSEYPVGRDRSGKLIAGFYAGRTHTVIDGSQCVIGIEENRYILDAVLAWMEKYRIPEYSEETGKGLIRNIMIRCGFSTGQIMTVIVANADQLSHEKELVQMLRKALPGEPLGDKSLQEVSKDRHAADLAENVPRHMASIIMNTNKARTNVILGRKNRTLWGSDLIEDSIGDVRYQISPLSFYQVNPVQTRKLYETALSYAGLTGKETVWDLYCGIGTISLFLARKAKMVYGVEVVPDAIENAKNNARLNHIDNARFLCGKAEEVLPREYREHQVRADVIVVDPPRKGLESNVIDTIASMTPERVVYVSCNSSTLARDLKLFSEKGYRTVKVQPVDMFPHSVHVETVALLSKLNQVEHVDVLVDMNELDLTAAESKPTYREIQDYVKQQTGLNVSNLNVAQVKRKYGLIERANYNLPKKEKSRTPGCLPEKEEAIVEALKHFGCIGG